MRCNFTAESMRTQHLDRKKTETYTVFINGGRSERPGFEFTRTRLSSLVIEADVGMN